MSHQQDEQIAAQHATSNPENESSQQAPESSTQGQPANNVDESTQIPEKFIGKSALEIAQAYRELERERGRMASELGSARKEQEEAQRKFRELEQAAARYNSMPTQVTPQNTRQEEEEQDPLSVLDQVFDEDPKRAIREALRIQQQQVARRSQEQSMQQRAQEAQNYYWQQKKENADYARREPIMQELVSQFQDVIRPEYLNSKKVLEALDLMSRGRDVDYYTKQAIATAQKNGSSVREEKRRSQSESASSEGEQLKDFSKLSSVEMAKLLGRSDE